MGRSKLVLAFILKNEGKTIEDAIKAIWHEGKPLYDELVIGIDDSTSDNTEEIVRKYTDHVSFFKWENSFSKARNPIIKKAEELLGEPGYILMPDGHEVLRPSGMPMLIRILYENNPNHKVIQPYILMMEDETNIPKHIFPRPIMWRTHEGIYWFKDVHNYIDFTDDEKRKQFKNTSRFVTPEMQFEHRMPHERKQWRNTQRVDMNVPGLFKQMKDTGNTNNPRDMFYLGNTYADGGDFDNAIVWLAKTIETEPDADLMAQACITIASLYYTKKDDVENATKYLLKAMVARFDRAEPYFYLSYMNFKARKMREAVHWGEIAYHMVNDNDIPITAYFLDGRIYSWYPSDILMTVYSEMQEPEKALHHANVVMGYLGEADERMIRNKYLIENSLLRKGAQVMLEGVKLQDVNTLTEIDNNEVLTGKGDVKDGN